MKVQVSASRCHRRERKQPLRSRNARFGCCGEGMMVWLPLIERAGGVLTVLVNLDDKALLLLLLAYAALSGAILTPCHPNLGLAVGVGRRAGRSRELASGVKVGGMDGLYKIFERQNQLPRYPPSRLTGLRGLMRFRLVR
ncbi:hypothetical protein B0J18DRAFT_172034 [Chaetomium sp. MPI-SDFR-AT-0129]|nr:hypothetical protein B0J18DRAFT_172034 [Chaetomium sp. MPI-SDFR-AT-0129]